MRVVLHANKEGVDIAKLLGGSICKEYGVRTITFCHPNQEKKRGHVAILIMIVIMRKEFMK